MGGLLAWAADVVGGGGATSNEGEEDEGEASSIGAMLLSPDQEKYARELDRKSVSLSRTIQDLRQRLPPPHISQRLPHLHAHSLASNADLALQFNAHSATRQQAHLREVTLQEENDAYEKAISSCENKIQEKLQEADLLQSKLKQMDLTEKDLARELENVQASFDASQSGKSSELLTDSKITAEAQEDTEGIKSALVEKLEDKKRELSSMAEIVRELEVKWAQVQDNALKQPSPGQREKLLDKQLHSLIEQLATKQAQAEGLISEIHLKEMELERVNGLWRKLETSTAEANAARYRFGRSSSERGLLSSDYMVGPHHKPSYHVIGRTENLQRQMLLRSAFVLYIFALHILVFIRISF